MPPDAAGDAQLAAEMCREEHFLLGMQSTSNARPNAAAMELVRWLLLDKPRPQMAFCFLQLAARLRCVPGSRPRALVVSNAQKALAASPPHP